MGFNSGFKGLKYVEV